MIAVSTVWRTPCFRRLSNLAQISAVRFTAPRLQKRLAFPCFLICQSAVPHFCHSLLHVYLYLKVCTFVTSLFPVEIWRRYLNCRLFLVRISINIISLLRVDQNILGLAASVKCEDRETCSGMEPQNVKRESNFIYGFSVLASRQSLQCPNGCHRSFRVYHSESWTTLFTAFVVRTCSCRRIADVRRTHTMSFTNSPDPTQSKP